MSKDATHEDIVLDALPYIDKEVEAPGVREMAEALIAEELALSKGKGPESSLPRTVDLFSKNAFLKDTYQRTVTVKAAETDASIDYSRYTLVEPTAKEPEAWEEAVAQAKIALEHQQLRTTNLELMQRYGGMVWGVHTAQLASSLAAIQRERDVTKKDGIRINKERKSYQLETGETLKHLDARWKELLSNNIQTQVACTAMEGEIAQWEQYESSLREEALAAGIDTSDIQ